MADNMKYKATKTYKGFVSIRSNIVEKAIAKDKGIVVEYNKQFMTIPHNYLKRAGQLHTKSFKSKYNEGEYFLYDFFFCDDNAKVDDREQQLF
jgi:hypothetical protein